MKQERGSGGFHGATPLEFYIFNFWTLLLNNSSQVQSSHIHWLAPSLTSCTMSMLIAFLNRDLVLPKRVLNQCLKLSWLVLWEMRREMESTHLHCCVAFKRGAVLNVVWKALMPNPYFKIAWLNYWHFSKQPPHLPPHLPPHTPVIWKSNKTWTKFWQPAKSNGLAICQNSSLPLSHVKRYPPVIKSI